MAANRGSDMTFSTLAAVMANAPPAINRQAPISTRRRSMPSTKAPMTVPNKTIGAIRATSMAETTKAEPDIS